MPKALGAYESAMKIEFFFAMLLALLPFFMRWRQNRIAQWPETTARLVEIEPQTLFERQNGKRYLNLDTDFAVEYMAHGKKYVKVVKNVEKNFRINGIKIWRSPALPPTFNLRYDPNKPENIHIETGDELAVKIAVDIFTVIGIVVFLYYGYYGYGT